MPPTALAPFFLFGSRRATRRSSCQPFYRLPSTPPRSYLLLSFKTNRSLSLEVQQKSPGKPTCGNSYAIIARYVHTIQPSVSLESLLLYDQALLCMRWFATNIQSEFCIREECSKLKDLNTTHINHLYFDRDITYNGQIEQVSVVTLFKTNRSLKFLKGKEGKKYRGSFKFLPVWKSNIGSKLQGPVI